MLERGDWASGRAPCPASIERGNGNRLGGTFEIRTQLFVDRVITDRARLGLALGHKPNAYTGNFNPGVETLFVTLGWSF